MSIFGGTGQFRGLVRASSLLTPMNETGAAATNRLTCVGPSTPHPQWADYLRDPATIPSTCADDQSTFAANVPSVSTFASNFRAPRVWRSSLATTISVGGFNSLTIEGSFAASNTQPIARDLNLAESRYISLPMEGGAFVFDPESARDTGVASGMRQLLQGTGGASECLCNQVGRIASLASCRTDWSRSLDVALWYAPPAHRDVALSLSAFNVPAALDRALHGSTLRGWGDASIPDPNLLIVRGFDPAARAFQYRVNPAFGTQRRDLVGSGSFALELRLRVAVGGDPARTSRIVDRADAVAAGDGAGASGDARARSHGHTAHPVECGDGLAAVAHRRERGGTVGRADGCRAARRSGRSRTPHGAGARGA